MVGISATISLTVASRSSVARMMSTAASSPWRHKSSVPTRSFRRAGRTRGRRDGSAAQYGVLEFAVPWRKMGSPRCDARTAPRTQFGCQQSRCLRGLRRRAHVHRAGECVVPRVRVGRRSREVVHVLARSHPGEQPRDGFIVVLIGHLSPRHQPRDVPAIRRPRTPPHLWPPTHGSSRSWRVVISTHASRVVWVDGVASIWVFDDPAGRYMRMPRVETPRRECAQRR